MKVEQVYTLANSITQSLVGDTAILNEDLSNVVDIGDTILNVAGMDKYVKSLTDHIGKVIFVNRPYSGTAPSVLMDGWEYGSICEKVAYDELPDATENDTWNLVNGQTYDVNTFTQPVVSAKFYNQRTTFEIPMSFAQRQVKSAFSSAQQLNAFFSMIYNAIDKSLTVKMDGLISRTINNMIAYTINGDTSGVRAVNLLEMYNALNTTTLTAAKAIYTPEFVRYASYIIKLYGERFTKLSKLFNAGGKDRFTSKDLRHLILLSDFSQSAETYLMSDTFHNELVALPRAESVPYWQGSGTTYDFASVSKINVTTGTTAAPITVEQGGILGIMFDRDSLGVTNLDRRVTTNWNAKGEFYNNWYKFDAGYFNDLNENFVVFYVADAA